MGRNDNQWQQMAALLGIASVAGAGMGAGSALMFAERRAAAQDRELESLTVRQLETAPIRSARQFEPDNGEGI